MTPPTTAYPSPDDRPLAELCATMELRAVVWVAALVLAVPSAAVALAVLATRIAG